MAKWRVLEEYTPFARLLVEYMWEQRPPLVPNQFADRMGVRKQALSTWLNSDAVPSPPVVVRLARGMGLPICDLMTAAGYASPGDPLLDRADAWVYVQAEVAHALDDEDQNGDVEGGYAVLKSSEIREALFALLCKLQERDEASLAAQAPLITSGADNEDNGDREDSGDMPGPATEVDQHETPLDGLSSPTEAAGVGPTDPTSLS